MKRKLYEELAQTVQARHNCVLAQNREWLEKHTQTLLQLVDSFLPLVDSFLPHGAGFNSGTKIDLDASYAYAGSTGAGERVWVALNLGKFEVLPGDVHTLRDCFSVARMMAHSANGLRFTS